MEGVGWIGTIIIGGIAGWIAEKFMKAEHGLIMNIIMGVLGALLLNFLLELIFGWEAVGWWMNFIIAIIGAALLIWGYRMVRGRT